MKNKLAGFIPLSYLAMVCMYAHTDSAIAADIPPPACAEILNLEERFKCNEDPGSYVPLPEPGATGYAANTLAVFASLGLQGISLPRQGYGVRQLGGNDLFGIIRPKPTVNGPYGEVTVVSELGGRLWKDKAWFFGTFRRPGEATTRRNPPITDTPFWSITVHGGSVSGSQNGLGVDVGPGANFAVPFSGSGGVFLAPTN